MRLESVAMNTLKMEVSTDCLPCVLSMASTIAQEENLAWPPADESYTPAAAAAGGGVSRDVSRGMSDNGEGWRGLLEQVELILLRRIADGRLIALFQLGQLYYEQNEYEKAIPYFEKAERKGDLQATFQLGVIHYDGLLGISNYTKGVQYMLTVATSTSPFARHLLRAAQHNIGKAYYEGRGVPRSDSEAERFWLLAADDGSPNASVRAQSTLGMFYSQRDTKDFKKAAFWHSEACGNGSLESQGALGVMYLTGIAGKRDDASAFICLRDAANRGNVFAMGHLVAYYYRHKLYTKSVETATKVCQLTDLDTVARHTDCGRSFINKGVAMAHFYYGRCLEKDLVIDGNSRSALQYYALSVKFDPQVAADLQFAIQMGDI